LYQPSYTVQCSAVQCSAVQCSAVQCSAVQCSAVQCSAVQCSAVQCSLVQFSAVQYSAVQCSSVQCNIIPSLPQGQHRKARRLNANRRHRLEAKSPQGARRHHRRMLFWSLVIAVSFLRLCSLYVVWNKLHQFHYFPECQSPTLIIVQISEIG
jgi:hypothetical protein